jgi:hypothetical protein
MTKQAFKEVAKNEGIYTASLYAAIAGISIAVVQLWLKSI